MLTGKVLPLGWALLALLLKLDCIAVAFWSSLMESFVNVVLVQHSELLLHYRSALPSLHLVAFYYRFLPHCPVLTPQQAPSDRQARDL